MQLAVIGFILCFIASLYGCPLGTDQTPCGPCSVDPTIAFYQKFPLLYKLRANTCKLVCGKFGNINTCLPASKVQSIASGPSSSVQATPVSIQVPSVLRLAPAPSASVSTLSLPACSSAPTSSACNCNSAQAQAQIPAELLNSIFTSSSNNCPYCS